MPIEPIYYAAISCLLLQTLAWLWQWKTENADIVDITWSVSIVACTIIFFMFSAETNNTKYLILMFPGVWYLRLSWHLWKRYKISHEDNRYRYLRRHWSENTQAKFFVFFIFQSGLSLLFALPAYWLSQIQVHSIIQVYSAMTLGVIALIGVTVADNQLLNFKRNPVNTSEVCNQGLWKYSRHPNYFFEWLHWFVYPILLWNTYFFSYALGITALMLLFLLHLTGIPFSEQQSLINRGDKYREYQSRTNKFFPWKPKKAGLGH